MTNLQAYTGWIVGRALPAWSALGFDASAGRFRERLDAGGRPLDVPHRAMVQARQIYVFARAAQLGWHADGAALAERAMDALVRDYATVSGGEASFAFSVAPNGRRVSEVRDAYTHAFVLFALAWLYRGTGDARLLTLADRVQAFVRARLVDPVHGGLWDADPVPSRTKRQNPLMHLLEAYLALERAAPGRGYLEHAARVVELFRTRLFSGAHGVLLEYFAEDWGAPPDAAQAGVVEPGHHFEWVWLLGEYAALSGDPRAGDPRPGDDLDELGNRLYVSARDHGLAAGGLVYDALDPDLAPRDRHHRLWPHTEGIKAGIARHAAGDPDGLEFADRMATGLLDHFLDRPFAGGWVDQIDAAHAPRVPYVPASSLYHLMFAATEAAGVLARPAAGAAAVPPTASRLVP